LAAKIRERRGLEATLIKGGGGQFDVVLDGRLLFSNKQAGRIPDDAEILDQIPEARTA
jgi:predicted Rdx family selenoprotein